MSFLRFVQALQRAFGQYQRAKQQGQRATQQRQRDDLQALRAERLALERERLALKRAELETRKAALPAPPRQAKQLAQGGTPSAAPDTADDLAAKLQESIAREQAKRES